MHSQVSSLNSNLKSEDVLAFIQTEIPNFNDIVDLDEGLYSVLGDFAIYLRDGINQEITSELDLNAALRVINAMGASEDPEVQNLLVVGIFEILTDVDEVIERVKQGLEGKAAQLFGRVLSNGVVS